MNAKASKTAGTAIKGAHRPDFITEEIELDRIIPYARNPRKNEGAIAKVVASLKEFGPRQPIVCDEDLVVIVGHTRLEAAKRLGWKTFPVHIAAGLSPAQAKAYRLADNRTNEEAKWDSELLAVELEDLRDERFDLALTGFDPSELVDLLGAASPGEFPDLPSGEKEPFQEKTFILHDEQAEVVEEALDAAKKLGPFLNPLNENANGNALHRICELFLSHCANR